MRFLNGLSAALVIGILGSTSLSAQSLRAVGEPAEFPPSSFTGKQYVDSRGCVYIRAGISGNTTWVPRVSRNRQAVCGFKQTDLGRKAPAAAPTKRVAKVAPAAPVLGGIFAPKPLDTVASIKAKPAAKPVAKQVVRKATPQPQAQPRVVVNNRVVAKPVTQQRVVSVRRVPAGQPKVIQRNVQPLATTPRIAAKPTPVKRQVAAVRRATPPVRPQAGGGCANASSFSSQYINKSSPEVPVRCGPQAGPIVTPGTGRAIVASNPVYPLGAETQQAAVQPQQGVVRQAAPQRRVATQRVTTQRVKGAVRRTTNVQIPEGYRQVWSDDRLNQLRAQVTAQGNAQSDLVWTRTVPRRLIDTRTRSDVTKLFARLRFPYVNLNVQQQADFNTRISTKSVKTPVPKAVVKQPRKVVAKPAPRKPATAAVNGKYVQIGTFGSPANVQKNVNRLKASGMPVRVANVTRKGKKLQIVLAGPFTTSSSTSNALRALKGAGYRDAFVR